MYDYGDANNGHYDTSTIQLKGHYMGNKFRSIALGIRYTDQLKEGWLYTTKTDNLGTFYDDSDITPFVKSIDIENQVDNLPSSDSIIKNEYNTNDRSDNSLLTDSKYYFSSTATFSQANHGITADTSESGEVRLNNSDRFHSENVTTSRDGGVEFGTNTFKFTCKKSGRIAGFRFKCGSGRSFIYKKTTNLSGKMKYENAPPGTFIGIKLNKINSRNNKNVLAKKLERYLELGKAINDLNGYRSQQDREKNYMLTRNWITAKMDYLNELYKTEDQNGKQISNVEFMTKTYPIINGELANIQSNGNPGSNPTGFGFTKTGQSNPYPQPARNTLIVKPILSSASLYSKKVAALKLAVDSLRYWSFEANLTLSWDSNSYDPIEYVPVNGNGYFRETKEFYINILLGLNTEEIDSLLDGTLKWGKVPSNYSNAGSNAIYNYLHKITGFLGHQLDKSFNDPFDQLPNYNAGGITAEQEAASLKSSIQNK